MTKSPASDGGPQNPWIALEKKYFVSTYPRYPVVFTKASGKYVWDDKGKKYLDFFAGLSVCNLGHRPGPVVQAVKRQAEKLFHASNLYYTIPQAKLAQALCQRSFGQRVFLSNSGAEANETAVKIARRFGHASGRYDIITFENSFHGRTLAMLAATGQSSFHQGFGPLVPGFRYAKLNDLESVQARLDASVCAVMIEPVQGEGGVHVADPAFLQELRKLCDEHDLLLIYDEVQTGMGRTGKLFAYEYSKAIPDIMTLAKSLAGGLPLGATVVGERAANIFKPGDHGSTFGGNLLSCAAALAMLKMLKPSVLAHVESVGSYFVKTLKALKSKHDFVREIRGLGLLLGMELDREARPLVEECLKNGLIINATQTTVLRFLPPLVITKSDVDQAVSILDKALTTTQNAERRTQN